MIWNEKFNAETCNHYSASSTQFLHAEWDPRINLVKPSSKNAQELHDLHRSMNEVAVKIGLDSFIEERSRSQPCPPFRIVPMVVSNNCSTIPSVVNMLENVSAQALVNSHSVGLSS